MRVLLLVFAVMLAVGLLFGVDRRSPTIPAALHTEAPESVGAASVFGTHRPTSSIASYPDRGRLLAYDQARKVIRSGASTWHPVQISEAHAFRAMTEGAMTVRAPNGEAIRLRYERHVEHPDGNWTWIGREEGSAPGTETVLTFGEKAVFGTIHQGNADLKVTTEAGSAWVVETGDQRAGGSKVAANDDDYLMAAGIAKTKASAAGSAPSSGHPVAQSANAEAVTAAATTTVDIAMGFTTGFAARLGGDSQARTRLNFLVDTTNQAFVASGIDAQIRLVHALQVDYPDATPSRTALFDLTSVDCTTATNGSQYLSDRRVDCTPIAQPAGLVPLTQARETYGADVLVLVRKFEDPEQVSCGSAWMLGGGQNSIDAGSAPYAMTVVSDSSGELFPDNGNTCSDLQLAHEIGHNFGQQHDVVTASGTDDSDNDGNLLDPEEFGRHPYSFGYSTDGTAADIATIMSNRRPSQTRFRVYANPLITCGTQPCGDAATADNARSMLETMPVVAQFRDIVALRPSRDIDNDGRSDLLWTLGDHTHWAYWLMNAGAVAGSADFFVNAAWRVVATGDFNGDGRLDLVWSDGAGMQMWLGGAAGFTGVGMRSYPAGWTIAGAGDVDADGRADLLWRDDASTTLALWLMDGGSIVGSAAYAVPAPWRVLATGHFNGDSRLDVVWTNGTAMQMWLGAPGGFSGVAMPNYPTDWTLLGAGDFDGDGLEDLVWRLPLVGEGYTNIWRMSGGSVIGGYAFANAPAWQPVDMGDFSGDGRLDIVWTDGSNMQMWTSTGSGFGGVAMQGYPAGWEIIRR